LPEEERRVRLLAAMLATRVEHAIPALVIRMALEGCLFVGTKLPARRGAGSSLRLDLLA
jgi:hypothetical protein